MDDELKRSLLMIAAIATVLTLFLVVAPSDYSILFCFGLPSVFIVTVWIAYFFIDNLLNIIRKEGS